MGDAAAVHGTAFGRATHSYSESQCLSMLSGCEGDLIAAGMAATGATRVLGTQLELMRVR